MFFYSSDNIQITLNYDSGNLWTRTLRYSHKNSNSSLITRHHRHYMVTRAKVHPCLTINSNQFPSKHLTSPTRHYCSNIAPFTWSCPILLKPTSPSGLFFTVHCLILPFIADLHNIGLSLTRLPPPMDTMSNLMGHRQKHEAATWRSHNDMKVKFLSTISTLTDC